LDRVRVAERVEGTQRKNLELNRKKKKARRKLPTDPKKKAGGAFESPDQKTT